MYACSVIRALRRIFRSAPRFGARRASWLLYTLPRSCCRKVTHSVTQTAVACGARARGTPADERSTKPALTHKHRKQQEQDALPRANQACVSFVYRLAHACVPLPARIPRFSRHREPRFSFRFHDFARLRRSRQIERSSSSARALILRCGRFLLPPPSFRPFRARRTAPLVADGTLAEPLFLNFQSWDHGQDKHVDGAVDDLSDICIIDSTELRRKVKIAPNNLPR